MVPGGIFLCCPFELVARFPNLVNRFRQIKETVKKIINKIVNRRTAFARASTQITRYQHGKFTGRQYSVKSGKFNMVCRSSQARCSIINDGLDAATEQAVGEQANRQTCCVNYDTGLLFCPARSSLIFPYAFARYAINVGISSSGMLGFVRLRLPSRM